MAIPELWRTLGENGGTVGELERWGHRLEEDEVSERLRGDELPWKSVVKFEYDMADVGDVHLGG